MWAYLQVRRQRVNVPHLCYNNAFRPQSSFPILIIKARTEPCTEVCADSCFTRLVVVATPAALVLLLLAVAVVVAKALAASVAASVGVVAGLALRTRAAEAIGAVTTLAAVQAVALLTVARISAVTAGALLTRLHRGETRSTRRVRGRTRTSGARERGARSSSGLGVDAVWLQVVSSRSSTRSLSVGSIEALSRLRIARSTTKSVVAAAEAATAETTLPTCLAGACATIVVHA